MERIPEDPPSLLEASRSVVDKARRMGPLRYSALDLGARILPAAAGESALAGWMADSIDEWWEAAGRPDPFTVVEVGAGDGTRARQVLGLGPECLSALRYVLVDRGFGDAQARLLPIESPSFLFPGGAGGEGESDDPDEGDVVLASLGIGPLVASLVELPVIKGCGAVIAIGWVGRLGSDRVEWRDGGWWEIRLSAAPDVDGLTEIPVPMTDGLLEGAGGQSWSEAGPAEPAESGARFAVLGEAARWLSSALRVAETGILAVVDRWTEETQATAENQFPPLALDQLAHIRRPIEPAPVEMFDGLSAVFWRLG